MNKCPECGRETYGAASEGGITWAICEDCYQCKLEQRDLYCINCGARTTYIRNSCNLCLDCE